MSDQNADIAASARKLFPKVRHQFCDWHAVQAMEKKMREFGMPTQEIRTIHQPRAWDYIMSATEEHALLTGNLGS